MDASTGSHRRSSCSQGKAWIRPSPYCPILRIPYSSFLSLSTIQYFTIFFRQIPGRSYARHNSAHFCSRFLELVIQEYEVGVDLSDGKNQGLNQDVLLQFFGAAVVGAVEWWFKNGMPLPPRVMAEQTGILLDRNF
ncbi:TetR-like C-terminal domain-containing protein [Cohnella candidum]|uniref:TetR-like C-terminal domain-containing protein n=1 Tax=Cohnella candidum TaxID=2674991 RepID=UPI0013DDCFA4|nr:TetR-like C-terminal domain-containing protein [Cohnella candidum]